MTFLMTIGEAVLAMIRFSHGSAELEPGPCEVQAEANVEGHIRVICVHIQPQVFTWSAN
jgi:hypothetical protein